ncbi:MAG: shikimate kinase [Acutalibacteraceae bacterium]|nr:shikimate kinase [Acutalibacteraceae bacterium]
MKMKNVVLIGMPGAGKSTIGVLLAKSLLCDFVDTDLVIQKKYGCSLCDIIEKAGTDGFIEIENKTVAGCKFSSSVIATGGSVVYGENAMKNLKENSITVYLSVSVSELENRLKNIHTRGVAMKKGATIADLFTERRPLYEKYADFTVDCDGLTAEECVERIVNTLRKQNVC